MPDLDDPPLPTPHDGWRVAAYAFDQARDAPTQPDGHGRLLVQLDVTVDQDGRAEGLVQFVHRDFATDIANTRLAEVIAAVAATVHERHPERGYLEIEHYADGSTRFTRLFDAAGLDELHRRLTADPGDYIGLDDFLAQLPEEDDGESS